MTADWFTGIKAFLFDLDGCLYFQDRPAPGARELLGRLQADGKRVMFVTNNSRQTGAEVASRLNGMSLPAKPGQVVTATDGTGIYLRERYGSVTVKVAGSGSFAEAIGHAGHRVLRWDEQVTADFVAIGRDTSFDYERLLRIAEEQRRGSRLIAANPDCHHPGASGERIPETGALCAAIESVCGCKIAYVGKPAPDLFAMAARACGVAPAECAMIGDNPLTDIAGGRAAGMKTVWLRGGQSAAACSGVEPDHTCTDASELLHDYIKA